MFIALLTDFGLEDYFTGAMKGAILSIAPDAPVIDISHSIPAHDIAAGNFCLTACYRDFPRSTIFVVVVDPGVGSARRGIVVSAGERLFVAPDNGVLTGVIEGEQELESFVLENDRYFRKPVCKTFHGRDIFAPVAAHLFKGVKPSSFGPPCEAPIRLKGLDLDHSDPKQIEGRIVHIDKFGNVITNIPGNWQVESIKVKNTIIEREVDYFAEGNQGELVFLTGSAGLIEICTNLGTASGALGAAVGDRVVAKL